MTSFFRIACPVCGEELIIPKWFGAYLPEEPWGTGGMAEVYRALDVSLDREIAIKTLKPGIPNRQERTDLISTLIMRMMRRYLDMRPGYDEIT